MELQDKYQMQIRLQIPNPNAKTKSQNQNQTPNLDSNANPTPTQKCQMQTPKPNPDPTTNHQPTKPTYKLSLRNLVCKTQSAKPQDPEIQNPSYLKAQKPKRQNRNIKTEKDLTEKTEDLHPHPLLTIPL